MFGPNATTFTGPAHKTGIFHHRGSSYRNLLNDTTALLREKCRIGSEFDIVFLTGSGTLANEAVLWSLGKSCYQIFHSNGEFSWRLERQSVAHRETTEPTGGWAENHVVVSYETAIARHMQPHWPRDEGAHRINFADCVSAFPYYDPPPGTHVWTTVSSKQLGAAPVLGIVVVRRDKWPLFRSTDEYSYLNLRRYAAAFDAHRESPHTPAMALLEDLRWQLLHRYDLNALRQRIDTRARWLEAAFGAEHVRGDGPVRIVSRDVISPTTALLFDLYRCAGGYQFFLYSGTDNNYEEFLASWQKNR